VKYANELKVGLTIVVSAVIFILGVRYFEDIPLFRGTLDFVTELDNAGGLISGNVVRINGVNVGTVNEVSINPKTGRVRALFHVDSYLTVPEGSYTQVSGFDALSAVRLDLYLGPATNPAIPDGGFIPSGEDSDLLTQLIDRAPALVDRVDSVLVGLDATLGTTRSLLSDPNSDLRATLTSVRGSMATLNQALNDEKSRISRVLANVDTISGNLGRFTTEQGDSLGQAVQHLNQVLGRLDRNLASLETTTDGLNTVLGKIDRSEGTLGMLINDPALYLRLDSTLTAVNRLLVGFETDPARFLRELKLVDIF